MLQRGQAVQAWAEGVLPKPIAGARVLVDEVVSTHVRNKFETFLHVLATPPWSMKVLRRIEDVTQENVMQLMTLASLCGSSGVPSIR